MADPAAEGRAVAVDFPVNLRLAGKAVLLVGGGRIAARKLVALRAAHARLTVVAPDVDEAIAAQAGPELQIERRPYRSDDLNGKWFVTEATGDPNVAAQVFADAEAAGIFCNAADRPASCSATLPAVHRTGALSFTFSTGGTIPVMAAWLRDHHADEHGADEAQLATLLADARAQVQAAGVSTETLDWRALLDSGILDEVRSGRVDLAKERIRTWLSSSLA